MKHIFLAFLMLLLPLQGCQVVEEQAIAAPTSATPEALPLVAAQASERSIWLDLSTLHAEQMLNLQASEDGVFLEPGKHEGNLLSRAYVLPSFDRLVASWKIDAPQGSEVLIEFQVGNADHWSEFYPLGLWSQTPRSQHKQDALGYVDIDTLCLNESFTELRFRLIFKAADISPTASNLGWTTWQEQERLYITPTSMASDIVTPKRSQFQADSTIASEICSPTCLAMLLEFYNQKLSTEEVARGCYDHSESMYGNWSLGTAYANSKGLSLRVTYLPNYDLLLEALQRGEPVICSIAFARGTLSGSPISSSPGHLVLVRGWHPSEEGQPLLLVNDPAAPDEGSVAREYRADEFFAAWNGITYLTQSFSIQ